MIRKLTVLIVALVLGAGYASSYQALKEARIRAAVESAHLRYSACVDATRDFQLCYDLLDGDLARGEDL